MPSVIRKTCPSCGQQHTFCYLDSDTGTTSRRCEFECPQTRRTVRVEMLARDWEPAARPRYGWVALRDTT